MSDPAVLANGSLSRPSHVVKRLERRGWVRREPCQEDGRATNAVLTEAGCAKTAATAPGHVEAVRSLVIDVVTAPQLQAVDVRLPRYSGPDRRGRLLSRGGDARSKGVRTRFPHSADAIPTVR